jgi:hypothetical protein
VKSATLAATTTAPENIVDSLSYECSKQLRLKNQLEAENFTCVDDPASLYDKIGTIQEVECLCQLYTPRLLCKLFVKGTEHLDYAFHLVPLWQSIKFSYIIPQPGEYFTAKYVIGIRRVGENAFVPSLRLPLT